MLYGHHKAAGRHKDTFKQIFRDHWEPFQQHQPRYQDRHVQAVIDNMLGCGTLEAAIRRICARIGRKRMRGVQLQEQLLPLLLARCPWNEWVAPHRRRDAL